MIEGLAALDGASDQTMASGKTRSMRKARWPFAAAVLAATFAVGASFAPGGAATDGARAQPAATNAAAVGLPVNAYQAGAWNVGVNSLPPVSGTVGATQSGAWNVGVNSLPPVSGTVGATQSGPWTVGVDSLPPVELAGTPTVNVANMPAPTTPPLWQGTPFIETWSSPAEQCHVAAIPSGNVLFIERAVASAVLSPGESYLIDLTLFVGDVGREVTVPLTRGWSRSDREIYGGTLDIGLPVNGLNICTERSRVTVFGYLLSAPAPQG